MGPRLVEHLLYEPEDSGILWIKFNRPERMNALVGTAEENGTVALGDGDPAHRSRVLGLDRDLELHRLDHDHDLLDARPGRPRRPSTFQMSPGDRRGDGRHRPPQARAWRYSSATAIEYAPTNRLFDYGRRRTELRREEKQPWISHSRRRKTTFGRSCATGSRRSARRSTRSSSSGTRITTARTSRTSSGRTWPTPASSGSGSTRSSAGRAAAPSIQAIFMEEIARSLAGISWIWGINQFNAKSIQRFASDELKAELMPQLVAGECKTAIAVTEPGAGTDLLGGMITTATPRRRRLPDQRREGLVDDGPRLRLPAAARDDRSRRREVLARQDALPRRREGRGRRSRAPIPKLGMRCVGSCEVFLDDAYVPATHVIGEVDRGWNHILTTLNNERILVAALSTGVLRGVIEDAVRTPASARPSAVRSASSRSIQHWIADMQMRLMQAELMTYKSAWLYDNDLPCHIESSAAKAIASEYATEAADRGIQILGGYGYSAEYNMQRYWRDARLYQIGPITNQMVRNLVAEDLGPAARVLDGRVPRRSRSTSRTSRRSSSRAAGRTGCRSCRRRPERVEAMLERRRRRRPGAADRLPAGARPRRDAREGGDERGHGRAARPEYFPVVVAALEAMFDPAFNLHTVLTSTGGAALCAVVSGPIAAEIGMNARHNALGPGNRANATIGRALRLIAMNVLGSRPGESDASSFGHPGKFTLCFAEDPPPAPWQPLSVRLGYAAGDTTVTVVPGEGPHQLAQQLTHSAEDVLRSFARSITHPTWFSTGKGGHGVLVLGPGARGLLRRRGLDAGRRCASSSAARRGSRPTSCSPPASRLEENAQHDMTPGRRRQARDARVARRRCCSSPRAARARAGRRGSRPGRRRSTPAARRGASARPASRCRTAARTAVSSPGRADGRDHRPPPRHRRAAVAAVALAPRARASRTGR